MTASDKAPRAPAGGFYAILDTGYVERSEWKSKAEALLRGGASLLQVRAKGESTATVQKLALDVADLCRSAMVPLIINDHLEVALAIPEAGLHIGQDDLLPAVAREQLGPRRLLGWSTHSIAQAKAALALQDILSYFAVGPVFPTGTKPDYQAVGIELVQQVNALRPQLPFFAIGGIQRSNMSSVLAAGAGGLVAVSDVLLAADTAAATAEFVSALQARANA